MPKYYEEDSLKGKKPCDGLREDLKECLANSECVKEGRSPKDCLANDSACQSLRNSFYNCKRSLIDMRARFRGPKGY